MEQREAPGRLETGPLTREAPGLSVLTAKTATASRSRSFLESWGDGFVVSCCGHECYRVEEAAAGLWSYHLRHAWGGMAFTCPECGRTYALAGLTRGHGAPSLVDLARVPENVTPLSPLQTHLLDVCLARDDALWEKSMDLMRAADEADQPALFDAALLLRAELQRQKAHTLRMIAWEHGLDGFPGDTRIFRDAEGGGWILWSEGGKPDGGDLLGEILARTEAQGGAPWRLPPGVARGRDGSRV